MIGQAEKTFKDIQNEYDHLFKTESVRDEDRAYRWHASQLFKAKPNVGKVLDVACGGGYFLRDVTAKSKGKTQCVGIDISSQALGIAQKECPQANYLISVAEYLPFSDRTFDAITCLGSLEHFLDIPKAIKEMKRIARPDGVFFILVPNLFWYKDFWSVLWTGDKKHRNQTQERFSSLGEWSDLFKSCGLEIQTVIKYNGIAKKPLKQWIKDLVIPRNLSYHFLFLCSQKQ